MVSAPSGAQLELRHGELRATVAEVGGGLRRLTAGGRDVLDGYAEQEMCSGGRGQMLLPWPNRVRDGRYRFAATEHQLSLTEPPAGNAIHGLTRWASWSLARAAPDRLRAEHLLHPQPGYPFALALAIDYELADSGLSVRTTAQNVGSEPCPFGAGAHPYLTVGTATVDGAELRAAGSIALTADERGIPDGRHGVESTPLDLRAPRPIGDLVLDTCFGELERDPDGLARTTLRDPATDRTATLWQDGSYPWVMLFTGDTLDPPARRRGLAVEPMTCPPNAFATGEDVLVLAPGERFRGTWGIDLSDERARKTRAAA